MIDPGLEAHVGESREFNKLVAEFTALAPPFDTPEGLQLLRENDGFFPREEVESAEIRTIKGPEGIVPIRILVPPPPVEGVYLDFHGGGWCIGSAAGSDTHLWPLANETGVATVSVDYRLAPENPFPAGPDDCEAAALWVLEHAEAEFGTDRLLIGGGSAGAHLAALTLLRLRDGHGVDVRSRFKGANLVFGAYDLGMTPSQRSSADGLVIPLATLVACIDNLLPGLSPEERRDPQYSPLYADLANMPPALFTVGTLDPVLDDSLFMAARWQVAGNEAELAVYPESVHGFVGFPLAMGAAARDRMTKWLTTRLRS